MKTKIQELRNLLNQLPSSPYANCIAGNSTIKYVPFQGYQIWAGGMNPLFEGSFEEVKEVIENEIRYSKNID